MVRRNLGVTHLVLQSSILTYDFIFRSACARICVGSKEMIKNAFKQQYGISRCAQNVKLLISGTLSKSFCHCFWHCFRHWLRHCSRSNFASNLRTLSRRIWMEVCMGVYVQSSVLQVEHGGTMILASRTIPRRYCTSLVFQYRYRYLPVSTIFGSGTDTYSAFI